MSTNGLNDVVATVQGTRAGDPFGDMIFAFLCSRVLRKTKSVLVSHDIVLPEILEVGESLMGCFDCDKADLFCANYVDDTMFPMCDKTYVGLLPKIVSLASIVFDCFAPFLLKPCFNPNKTTSMFGLMTPELN